MNWLPRNRRRFLKSSVAAAFGTAAASVFPSNLLAKTVGQAASAVPRARIKIDFERRIGKIDRNIYGNFTEHLGRCIYGGIYDEGSPLSDQDGFRKDVLDAARAIHIPLLRWPGGNFSSGYNWKDGVGPRANRPRKWDTAWQAEESNRFGTDEFIAYCRKLGAEPYICVNMGTGNMQLAADWVEYCNGKMNTEYANLRRKNGHAEPYNVKYWGLGNEIYGPWQAGHKSAKEYAENALEFAKMMRWIDPSIKLVVCGGNYPDWDREVLERLVDTVDYISTHFYGGSNDTAEEMHVVTRFEKQIEVLDSVITEVMTKSKRKDRIRIAADEWNIWFRTNDTGDKAVKLEEIYNLQDALWVASALNIFHRHCSTVTIANMAQLVNVIAPMMTNANGLVLQTTYYPLKLYTDHAGDVSLDALVRSETFPGFPDTPYLDISATTDEGNRKLTLAVVNRHPSADIAADIAVEGFKMPSTGDLYELNGPNVDATNTFTHPNQVTIKKRQASSLGATFSQSFPAHSVTMIVVGS
jgi:alpha-N-arabinofuranosidase